MTITLLHGERVLRKDAVSFIRGSLQVRPGLCYLTNRRLIAESVSPAARALMAISPIGRLMEGKLVKKQRVEIELRDLVRIAQERYGLNPNVLALFAGGELVLKIVFSRRQMEAWLQTLDQALRQQGKSLRRQGEGEWYVELVRS